ncbi:GNAT family N-acetyltransferase [Oceanicola sp. 502str15]|uniref:GNAT family N-acetyltransferase n=1 Tax=Oceanicola sp. 502str15 TaxID=2696061 RepID=UPI00209461D5|nr:GNAT family N-acetyltransferase [Oceanicola sp. 502str15]MCO6384377.1 GNAT family N-acetyltransferase [Oceanicola sp. 502str15]
MVTLRRVERDDVNPLIRLVVAPDQDHWVSNNAISLAQAAYTPGAYPFAILDGERHVGLALMLDWREADRLEEGDDPEGVFLWRLMIGAGEQGKGYGAAALGWLTDWARARGAKRFVLSHMHENPAAAFYEKLGFVPTGRERYGGEDLERALEL